MKEELEILKDLYLDGSDGPWCIWALYYCAKVDGLISTQEYQKALNYYGDSWYYDCHNSVQ